MAFDAKPKPDPGPDPLVHFVAEAQGNYVTRFISDAVKAQTGYAPERFMQEPDFWAERVHPEDKSRVFAAMRNRGNTDPLVIEYRFRHADGSWRWRREQQSLVRDARGEPEQIVGSWTDITREKGMEDGAQVRLDGTAGAIQREEGLVALGFSADMSERERIGQAHRASEKQLRLITDSLPVLIVYFDSGCRYQFVNKTAERWYARPAGEIVGRHLREVLGESTYERLAPHAHRVLKGKAHSFDSSIAYPDGNRRDTHQIYVPRKDDRGNVLGFYAMVVDISDRKRAEDALRQSQQRLHLITDSLPVLILYFDRDMRYRVINRTAEKWYARPKAEIIGKSVREILGEPTFGKLRPYIEGVLRGDDQTFDARLPFPDGTARDVHIIYVAHKAPDGEVVGYYVLAMDMTASRQAERKIRQSRENLRRLAKRLEDVREEERRQIAYEIHDDIGQLLTGLKLAVSELLEKSDPDSAGEPSEASLIVRLFDELFDKVRTLAKRLRPGLLDELGLEEAVSVQLDELAGRAGWAHRCRVRLNGLRLPPDYEIVVFRVVQEALTNAARHARAKQVDVTITRRDNSLQVEVVDDGVGIQKNHTDSGESLGLVSMRERAGSIGGRLEIRPRRGGGTAVRLRVPLPAASTP